MNILLISYYFKPFKGVGAKRLSYWYENFPSNYSVKVLTATKQPCDSKNIIYIEPKKSKNLIAFFIKDKGIDWVKPIKKFFKDSPMELKVDFIIISGGPFMHFSLTRFFRKQTNSKILLDFRDPFSDNPLFNNQFIKYWIKRKFEQNFIKNATAIITVNKFCAKHIVANNKPVYIIDNGYLDIDKNLDKKELVKDKINLVFTGSFKSDPVNLEIFSNFLLNNRDFFFHHVGIGYLPRQEALTENYKNYGQLDYLEAIEILNSADITILFTRGYDFKSSTKIFDYIALNKKILIITEGKLKTGNLYEISKDYPNVLWARNCEVEICDTLKKLTSQKSFAFDSSKYSRKHGLEKLIKILKEINKNG
jgi:hypothetical protein